MKTIKILIASLALTSTLNAQIKIFSGGSAVVGSTGSPLAGAKLQVTGRTYFTTATGTVTATSAAYIRSLAAYSTVSTPDYTWYKDSTSGFFHPSSGIIGLTISGSEKFRFNNVGQILNSNSTSAVGTPDFSWNSDPNTGFYRPANDVLGFVANGSEKMRINSSGQILNSNSTSSVSAPDFSWNSDVNTGFYRPANDVIGFVANGGEKMRINSSGQILNSNTSSSVSTPDFGWNSDLNTGMYHPGEDKIAMATGGVDRFLIEGANFRFNQWTDVILNYDSGYCCSTPVLYPENDWYLQLGTPSKFLGNAYITHEIYKVAPSLYSDVRVKQNVDYNMNTLTKLQQLKPAKYNFRDNLFAGAPQSYKNKMTSILQYGLIAQDVLSIFPELVDKDSLTGLYSIQYTEFIPILIDAVQKQQEEIETLKADLNQCCTKKTSGATNRATSNPTIETNPETNNWLSQNKPNPFNKETVIEYNVVQEGKGSILIFDMNGKLLKTIPVKIPGKGSVTITANDLPAGMYYYSLVVNDNEVDTKKMILTQ